MADSGLGYPSQSPGKEERIQVISGYHNSAVLCEIQEGLLVRLKVISEAVVKGSTDGRSMVN